MFKGLTTTARFAFKEIMRKKVMLAAVVLTILFLAIYGFGIHFLKNNLSAADQYDSLIGFQLFSMGLYMAMLITGLLAAFAGVGAISGEIESGTAYALLVKPVSRTQLLLGKFLGYGVMLVVYSACFFLAIWGLIAWQFGTALPGAWQVLPLFALQPLILLGVSFLGSSRLSTLTNGITLFLLFGVALVGGMLEQIGAVVGSAGGAQSSQSLVNVGIVSSLLLPVDSLYRRAIYLMSSHQQGSVFSLLNGMGPFGGSSAPSTAMVIYAVCYLLFCLWLASRSFAKRDI